MGYYFIQLSENKSNLYTIIIALEKYQKKRLPVGVSYLPDIFQHKMNDLFHGFKFISKFIDNILILSEVKWTDTVQNI